MAKAERRLRFLVECVSNGPNGPIGDQIATVMARLTLVIASEIAMLRDAQGHESDSRVTVRLTTQQFKLKKG